MSALTWFVLGAAAGVAWISTVRWVAVLLLRQLTAPKPAPVVTLPPPRPPTELERAALLLAQGRTFECGCPSCSAERQRGGLN